MGTSHVDIWRNLTTVTSVLVGTGLATNFNGVLTKNEAGIHEIAANVRKPLEEEEENAIPLIDSERDGYFRDSEYADMSRNRNYTLKFLDGGLVQYFCAFRGADLIRQRLTFYQSPLTRAYDSETGYDQWMDSADDIDEEGHLLFGHEVFEYRDLVSFRLEFAPEQHKSIIHPRTHFHLNSFEGCRIPVKGPVGVAMFFQFVVKNFYSRAWQNIGHKLIDPCNAKFESTLDSAESKHLHFSR